MDNSGFDKVIKDKLESLQPAYREGAWEELQYKLDLLAPIPWYARWKSGLVVGSLALITLFNAGILYKVNENQKQVDQVLQQLDQQKSASNQVVHVTTSDNYLGSWLTTSRTTNIPLGHFNWDQPSELHNPLSVYRISKQSQSHRENTTYGRRKVRSVATPVASLSAAEEYFNRLANRPVKLITNKDAFATNYQSPQLNAEDIFVRGIVVPATKKKWENPLDLRLGIASGYLVPDPDLGERFVSSRQTLYLETPISSNVHALTGVSFQEMTYKLDDVDDDNFSESTLRRYPDFTSFTNTPDEIQTKNQMLQFPLYLRYYRSLNDKWSVFLGGGPVFDLLLKQRFTYSFLEIRDEQLVEFEEIRFSRKPQFTLGSISGHAGIEHYFSPRLAAQVELNYQYGLGNIGLDRRSFNSFSISGGLFYKLKAR